MERGRLIPSLDEPVESFRELFCNKTDESRRFMRSIRKYNKCFHMTSFGADKMLSMPGFSMQGQVYQNFYFLFILWLYI